MTERPYFLPPQTTHFNSECELKVWALPFVSVRHFTIRNYSGGERERGGHAHRAQWQALQVLSGRVFILTEQRDGWSNKVNVYSSEDTVFIVPPLTWLTLRLHDGARVLVQASGLYDENEYMRNRSDWEAM